MEFVTDRTEADVLLGNAKGRYSAEDLNRVESAVAELCALAVCLDVHLDLITKTDWSGPGVFSQNNWPTESQMERYLQNVNTLCDRFSLGAGLPGSMADLDHQGANAIEQALQQTYKRIDAILSTYRYSGEIYAGEEICL